MSFKIGDTVRKKGKVLLTGRSHKYFVLEKMGNVIYLGDVMVWGCDDNYFTVSSGVEKLEQTKMVLFEKYIYPYREIIKRRNV